MTAGFSTSSSCSWLAKNCGWSAWVTPHVHTFALSPLLCDYSPVQRDVRAPQPRPPLLPRLLTISTGYSGASNLVPWCIPSPSPHVLNHPPLIHFLVQILLPDVRSQLRPQATPFSPTCSTPTHTVILAAPIRFIEKLVMHRHGCISPCRIYVGHFFQRSGDLYYLDPTFDISVTPWVLHCIITSLVGSSPSLS